ncbi:MAG: hypothetical protein LBF02_01200 [Mycoplasmataceae bacterium]|nr:hypothetical protein [Mycoplasmataceae bacterium]
MKKLYQTCSQIDDTAEIEDVYDSERKDVEYIPFEMDEKEYFKKEVDPFLKSINGTSLASLDSFEGTMIEFNFNKEFYKLTILRSSKDILNDIKAIDEELNKLQKELFE